MGGSNPRVRGSKYFPKTASWSEGTSPEVQNRGISGSIKRIHVLQIFLEKNVPKVDTSDQINKNYGSVVLRDYKLFYKFDIILSE